jgi:integrase
LAGALTRVSQGTFVELGRQTVAEYLRQWLDGKVRLKPSTRHGYETHCQLYLVAGLGHLRLSELRDHHIEELYDAMRQLARQTPGSRPSPLVRRLLEARSDRQFRRPPGPARIRRVHGTLMSALNSAVKRGKIARNPGAYVELPSGRAPRPVVWTPERVDLWKRTGKRYPVAVWTPQQAGAFLDFASGDRLAPLWHLVAYRGLRRAEVVGLPWANVDLATASATIRDTIVQVDHVSTRSDPKSDAGERTISLDTLTVAVLRAHRRAQAAARLAWGAAWVDSGLVFTKEDGSALNPDAVSQRFERLVARSGLPPIRLHDLRHVAASLALAAGVPMKVVSEQLGHSGIQITSDIYSSVLPQVAQAAAEAVAALIPRAAGSRITEPPSAASATPWPHPRTNRTPTEVAARTKPQVKDGGAGGARTRDRGIMSPLL